MPGFAGQVVHAVVRGVGLEPAVGPAGRADRAAADGEVDGEALLVHRGARPGGGRPAGRRRRLVDRIVGRAAVGPAHGDLVGGVAVPVAAHRVAGLGGVAEQALDLPGDGPGDLDGAAVGAGD